MVPISTTLVPQSNATQVKRLRAGQLICERYELISLIGQGGMGEVWKAQARNRPNAVALKLLPPEFCSARQQQRMRERFSLVERLTHPNICTVMDLNVDPTIGPFLVMRYLEGITLAQYIQRQRGNGQVFQPHDVHQLLGPVASALDYAHDQGVVHRDIKPENIIVAEDGRQPVIVDFELAEQIRDTLTKHTADSSLEGTLAYLSPEAWRGKGTNRQSDQYALALIAYEMLAGDLPFERNSHPDVLRQCTLLEAIPAIPYLAAANCALSKGLAKEPRQRYSTCTAFIDAIAPRMPSMRPHPKLFKFILDYLSDRKLDRQWMSIAAAVLVFFLIIGTRRHTDEDDPQIVVDNVNRPANTRVKAPEIDSPKTTPLSIPHQPTALETQAIRSRNESVEQHRKAEGANAPEFAIDHWQTATSHTLAANEALKRHDYSNAIVEYDQAAESYKQAIRQAQHVSDMVKQMPALQTELGQLRQQAEVARAQEFALEQLSVADSATERFNQFKQNREYQSAFDSYQQAKVAYVRATEEAIDMGRMDESRIAYDREVSKLDARTLDRFGGRAWKKARERIETAKRPLNPKELGAAYRDAMALIPNINSSVRDARLAELARSGQHKQVLNELWPDYSTASPELRDTFLRSAAAEPEWWLEQAEASANAEKLPAATMALLTVSISQSARDLGRPGQAMIDEAEALASSIRDPLDALLTSFEVALELAKQAPNIPSNALENALVQVERDIKGLDSNLSNSEKANLHAWIKNYIRLRCAAILWRLGKKDESDAISRLAYAASDSSRSFYYDLPSYHAVMVFAEAGDLNRLSRLTVLHDGQLKLAHIEGQRPYQSLLSHSIGLASMNHSETNNNDSLFAFGHAEVALAASRNGQRDMFLVHYRRASELVEASPPVYYKQLSQLLSSTLQSRLAIAEAYQQDFVSALGRMRGAIKDRLPLGEAGVEIGRLQLRANPAQSRDVGIKGARTTLELLRDSPNASTLAREIAIHMAHSDLAAAVQWARETQYPAHKAAILAGISSGLKRKD